VLAKDGRYVTYGTIVGAGTGKRCGATGKLFVAVLVHGSGSTVGFTDCASADVMPNGPGAWAEGNGWAVWSTRRDALKSTDITWDTKKTGGGTHVVENPSMFKAADGYWYLAYSGNNWDSARYATGIAKCGTAPIPGGRCTPVQNGVERPYFGFTGDAGLNPYRGLPGNHRGPGGFYVS
jgi:hypothetical protein